MQSRRRRLFLLIGILCGTLLAGAARGDVVLVRDGRPAARVLVPADASATVCSAIDTLRYYLQEISGAILPLSHDATGPGPRIFVEAGGSADGDLDLESLGRDGFRIRTTGRDLVLTARSGDGLRNAVYTLLETYLGCRKYSVTVQVIPRRETLVLGDIDDTQIPPIAFRMQDLHDPAYVAWHKLDTNEDFGLFVHTFSDLVPPERYYQEHPEYYSLLNGHRTPAGQLCLTNPDVFDLVVAELRARMAERPEADFWSVSQNDTYAPCECATCRAIDEAEGGPSGSILAFVNRVADAFPDKTISTLAYEYSRSAPRHLKPRPNVNIMLCSIECNRSRPLADDPGSAAFVRDLRDWTGLTHNIFLWDYVIQFRSLVSPFPNLRVLQPNIRFFAERGITSVFEQGLPVMHGEFAELRMYLIAKLLWNPQANVDLIMDDFLQGFYGRAAPFIRRYIDTMHEALAASGEDLSIYGYPLTSADGYLSPRLMATYEALFERAEAAVQDEPDVLARVRTARLPLQFARLEQAKMAGRTAGGCFLQTATGALQSRPEFRSLLSVFAERCRAAGIPRLWEHGISPDDYEASTARFFTDSTTPHLALDRPVVLEQPASPKYHGGEASALTDGCKGWDDFHFHWLGCEGQDLIATVDLGTVREVSSIATDFLQDINSWIFMPLSVSFAISVDGVRFRDVGHIETTTPPDQWGAVIAPYDVTFAPTRARYIRVTAINRKTCPPWHKGSGGPAWIFIDEIAPR